MNNHLETNILQQIERTDLLRRSLHHPTMFAKGVLSKAIELAASDDDDIMQYGAFALANFCSNPESHLRLGRDGAIPPLIGLANSEDDNQTSATRLSQYCNVIDHGHVKCHQRSATTLQGRRMFHD